MSAKSEIDQRMFSAAAGFQSLPPLKVFPRREMRLLVLESFSITKCHLKNLDIHLFEIWVEMTVQDNDNTPVTQDIRIRASNWFKESLQNLSEGDSITFRAAFHDGVCNIWPEINLFYLQCVEKGINFGSKAFISETSWRVVDTVRNGTIAAWNFLLSPFLQIG